MAPNLRQRNCASRVASRKYRELLLIFAIPGWTIGNAASIRLRHITNMSVVGFDAGGNCWVRVIFGWKYEKLQIQSVNCTQFRGSQT